MMMRRSCQALKVMCWGFLSLALAILAAEPKAPDPDLPQPVDPGFAQKLLENPPFTRALNLSDSLSLTGVAYVDGKTVATVKDRTTNKSYVVTDEPNVMGWRLAEASPSSQLKHAEVKIMIGSEIIPVRYNLTLTAAANKGYMPSKIPTPEEFTGHDDKGPYVRGMSYLNDTDRDRFRKDISSEVRQKFLDVVHDHREMLFKASHEERAAFVKKAFDAVIGK